MTRIIAGWAGSRQLAVPSTGTRPTSDRVREALFSGLDARDALRGAAVLDLYAGSGALALEAVSRGAVTAVLVEQAAEACRVLRRNAEAIAAAAPAPVDVRVVRQPVARYLAGAPGAFDVVFLDPPYDLGASAVDADLAALRHLVVPGGTVVLERAARGAAPRWPDGFIPSTRTYGDTALHIARV